MTRRTYPILIVDDENSILLALKRELIELAPVITASDTVEAKKILESHTVAVIISDYKMPGVNGVDFLESLTELAYEPVKILITAYSDMETVIDAVNRAGIYAFVKKPWDYKELQITLKRALDLFYSGEELKYCKKRLNELDSLKKSITGLLAHELRTPLTTIAGYSELLEAAIVDVTQKKMAASLNNSVQRLVNFVEDILNISRIESGELLEPCSEFDFGTILKELFNIDISKKTLMIKANHSVVLNAVKKLSLFINKFELNKNIETFEYTDLLIMNFYLNSKKKKCKIITQLSLFEGMEPNDDIMNYDGDNGLDIVFVQKVFMSFGAKLSLYDVDHNINKLELAIPFISSRLSV